MQIEISTDRKIKGHEVLAINVSVKVVGGIPEVKEIISWLSETK